MTLIVKKAPLSEAAFQRQVVGLAKLCGWRVAHFRPARTAKGWRTPVAADGKGWPDLVLVHPRHGILFRELKRDGEQPTPDQVYWLTLLRETGCDADVWRPRDWDTIVTTLRGE